MSRRNPISPRDAERLDYETLLPTKDEFIQAVLNTPGVKATEKGLLIDVERWQKPDQSGARSVRSAVFYLPVKSKSATHYRKAEGGYGGSEHITGTTLIRRPLFVKGATGGKAPEEAYKVVTGDKKAVGKLDDEIFKVLPSWGRSRADEGAVADLLERHGADPDLARDVVTNSTQGNTLRYAIRELIYCTAARRAGYDSIIGWSMGRGGKGAFFSEIIDLREDRYPWADEEGSIHPDFKFRNNPGQHYPVMTYAAAHAYEPLAEKWGVSQVARSARGFMRAYQKAGTWSKLPEFWQRRRNGFVARHMAQVPMTGENLWKTDKKTGKRMPSRRCLALIQWAYLPPGR